MSQIDSMLQDTCSQEKKKKTQIAILGGAFNPVTLGHVQLANYVYSSVPGLFDKIWLMPSSTHPFNKNMVSSEHRLAMCHLACEDQPHLGVFDYEIRHQLPGQTYILLNKLYADPAYQDFEFAFIIGQDNANYFHKWAHWDELVHMIRFVVVPRKEVEADPLVDWYMKDPHIVMREASSNKKGVHHGDGDTGIMKVSSTQVRSKLQNLEEISDEQQRGERVKELLNGLVDQKVAQYIAENKLYIKKLHSLQ